MTIDAKRTPIRVVFLVRSLEVGGAEAQLATIAIGLNRDAFEPVVVSFYSKGPLQETLREAGISVISLEKRGRWHVASFFRTFLTTIRALQPDVIHSFMGPPNLLAISLRRWVPNLRIVWGIRSSNMDLSQYDFTWRVTFWLEGQLSKMPDRIAVNSFSGRDYILAFGYCGDRLVVVPNGVDVEKYRFDPVARATMRLDWGVKPDQTLIGLIGRLDPMKDHANFLRAASNLSENRPNVCFICVGSDGRQSRNELQDMGRALGLGPNVIWKGYDENIPGVLSAIDVLTSSSSYGEGFSNVVAEAMAVGVPSVVTDVGDSGRILGDCGFIVPPKDPRALANAWRDILGLSEDERRVLSTRSRARVASNYSVDSMIQRMEAIYTGSDKPPN